MSRQGIIIGTDIALERFAVKIKVNNVTIYKIY